MDRAARDRRSAWQRAVVATGLFDGVHLDVERVGPGRLARHSRPPTLLLYWRCSGVLAADCPLPLEADIAFHLHKVPTAPQRLTRRPR